MESIDIHIWTSVSKGKGSNQCKPNSDITKQNFKQTQKTK